MGFNFRKSIKIAPGINLNIGKTGIGISAGVKGARFSVNSSGKTRQTFSIPGTGISYTNTSSVQKTIAKLTGTETKKTAKKSAAAKSAKTEKIQHPTQEETDAVNENAEQIQALKEIHRFHLDPVDWSKYAAGSKTGTNAVMSKLASGILAGDMDSMVDAVQELQIFEEIAKYGSGFEMGMQDAETAVVEFDIAAQNVLPEKILTLTASGKLSEKAMSKSAFFDLEQDYACSMVLRIAADLFALLPVSQVLINVNDITVNPATGNDETICILSTLIDRRRFEKINLDRVDPSDCLESFDTKMKFYKTRGFDPVEPIEL